MSNIVRIAITPGEPAGIGPELTLKLAQQTLNYEVVAIANIQMLQQQSKQLGLGVKLEPFDINADSESHHPGQLKVINVVMPNKFEFGKLDATNSSYVIETLKTAVNLVQSNTLQALTTGPVQKSIINEAGIAFSGHTEFIADKTGGHPVMLLANENLDDKTNSYLRVALITTHLPVSEVAKHISAEKITKVLNVLHDGLVQRFGIANPCIAVCGLNPHAGEGGHLGKEESEIIIPTLDKLRQQGMNLEGPLPADTAFTQQKLKGKDAVVAMYHDQGLPVIKHQGFGKVVNVTLGLPIIRTSVDHGTALDIAGQGIADESSLLTAVNLAAKLCEKSLT
ncbi:MAG: 4-hydroxythreonine-4-phosphate dehydrogenase PdxA [Gammaproteobacteria bacterium]|nr:4-hydroxythreonine-4-phosphate dehydrogenase PdxA [Gammaproteobacteria bacterium]NNC66443.1 4-hydroxythreonine-4-phosphate dehydrogenase PdxA [Gammaproteobacteria bacterium]